MVSAAKWPLSPGASFWRADGRKAENASVCNGRGALRLTPVNLAPALITFYQKYIRPVLPKTCRFEPSCSEYAEQAILKHGFIKGVFKGLMRIFRCHPFSGRSGYDPLV